MALFPDRVAAADLRAGKLVRVFPEWYVTEGIVHLVFTSRRGLPPAVRALIEHLASHIHDDVMKEGDVALGDVGHEPRDRDGRVR
ncbi:LysR substrate-binding domain-containing protein [Sorangium sp. So ce341]|uniref:LysR substrate-binding domain-containing protein n=1 Tax=Sorangium sp. So ce341 TaxID=3133302 RepID=UPI003F615CAB